MNSKRIDDAIAYLRKFGVAPALKDAVTAIHLRRSIVDALDEIAYEEREFADIPNLAYELAGEKKILCEALEQLNEGI